MTDDHDHNLAEADDPVALDATVAGDRDLADAVLVGLGTFAMD